MIIILSPAKTLDFSENPRVIEFTKPLFMEEASEIMKQLKKLSVVELSTLMKVSDQIAELNFIRNLTWEKKHELTNAKMAIFTYAGTVYKSFKASMLSDRQLEFAQKHIRIFSGLYGVLRPFDIIQPYRLEMGIRLKNPKGRNMYEFWGETITTYLFKEMAKEDNLNVINLASKEYSSVLDLKEFKGNIINIVFKEYRSGKYKIIAINAKKARGLMAHYIVENYIDMPEELKKFQEEGYKYDENLSGEYEYVFIR